MNYFLDLLLLFLCSFSAVFFTDAALPFVLAFCCSLLLGCSCYFLESRRVRFCLLLLFAAAAFVLPDFFCFYSFAVYLLLRENQPLPAALAAFVCAAHALQTSGISPESFFSCLWLLLAALLFWRTRSYQTLLHQFHCTRDDSQEKIFLQAEKNRALMEKQDSQIYAATLRERNRIAREIHDNVGHMLSRSILMIGAAKAINTQEALTPTLLHLDTSLNLAMDSIRQSVHDLHDDSVNLEDSIRSMIREFTFCPVKLSFDMSWEVPKEIKYCFLAITREAFSNIIRHSRATQAQVIMREHPALYQLCIEDNGGEDAFLKDRTPSKAPAPTARPTDNNPGLRARGMGLSNMEERVKSLGGNFQAIQEHGFKIFITIPRKMERTD